MANTIKAFNHPNGTLFLDCGLIRGVYTGYAITATGAVEITEEELTEQIENLPEAHFDGELLNKVDSAIYFTQIGKPVSIVGLRLIMAIVQEKAEDFDGPTE